MNLVAWLIDGLGEYCKYEASEKPNLGNEFAV